MSWRRSVAIARADLRITLQDPFTIVILVVIPVLGMVLMKPTFGIVLTEGGNASANGSEHTVPGQAVTFGLFAVNFVGFGFLREHGWGTWERLRATWATPSDIIVGKLLPPLGLVVAQQVLLFGIGFVFLDLDPGSPLAVAALTLAVCVFAITLGVLLAALCRTAQQMGAFANIGILLAFVGGAFVPISTLPGWARAIAPASPAYWAMRGYRAVLLDGGGVSAIALPIAVLLAWTLVTGTVAARRFRFEETKTGWG